MSRFYADGRPAELAGRPVRYDAGGRAHLVGSAPSQEPTISKHGLSRSEARAIERNVSRLFRDAVSLVGFYDAEKLFSDAGCMEGETWTGKDDIALELVDSILERMMRSRIR